MRHQKKKVTLDRKVGPRKALLRNLATSVVLYEKVKTTRAKAKAVQPIVERCVTLAKTQTLTARRRLLTMLAHPNAVRKMFEVFGPRYTSRNGGYTRIIKIGRRVGDAAEIVQIEFV
ncbi:MAG: 50S ribosomal protein L17 [bacterium]|nr:50S ribosomal protein L17 [bacterium]MDO8581593.1 50S ribosomal protein L17 [bacterium]